MIKTSRDLGRSLVRRLCYRLTIGLAVLTFWGLLPFVSFGDLVPDDMLFNIWPYFYVRGGSSPALSAPTSHETAYSPITASALDSYFFNNRFAVALNPDFTLSFPNIYPSGILTNSSMNSTFSLQALDGSGWYCPVRICPSIQSYASISARLFLYGYNGNGIDTVGTNRNGRISFNVNPSILFSEVLYGTNYLYRQTLINYLSSINSSVQNIDLNVSGLQSSIDQGNNILSNISQNTTFALSTLSDISQSSSSAAFSLSQVSSNTLASAASLSQVSSNTLASAASLSQVSSNTLASASSLSQVSSNSAASVSALSDISVNTSASAASLDDVKTSFGRLLLDTYDIRANGYSSSLDLEDIRKHLGASLFGNGVPSPDNPWFPYDPNNPDDPNNPINPNSPWNPNSPRSVAGGGGLGAFTTNQVLRPLTNSVRQASADIQSNATENADRQIDNANDNWQEFKDIATGDGEGLNVKIKFPLWEEHGYHVNVRDDAVLEAIQNLHAMPSELTSIKDNIQWLKDGGPMNINLPTNLVDILDEILDAITNRPSNSYLLLDDYAVYISNGVYQSSIEQLQQDFPNVYTNLQKYGLTSSGNGNFWTLFGANLIYQSGLIGSLLEDMATIRKFADDHIEGGFAAGIKSIVEKFPSPTQLSDDVNNATNRLYEISLASTNLVLSFESVTNIAPSVFKPFADSFDSPPSCDIVFFKTANDQYVSIPVHEQASVWSLIRMGIGFALIGVQFLLFPKFVLFIVVLFERLSNRFVKFVPTDR